MPNIETVKYFITKVQKNMEKCDDGDVEKTGEHDTEDLNMNENDIASLQLIIIFKGT